MAEPADGRSPAETLFLAGVGTLARLAERADELADVLAQRLGDDRRGLRLGDRLLDGLGRPDREQQHQAEGPGGDLDQPARGAGHSLSVGNRTSGVKRGTHDRSNAGRIRR